MDLFRVILTGIIFLEHSTLAWRNVPNFKMPSLFIQNSETATMLLIMLSGFLIGQGFYSGKYTLDLKGVLSFYLNRLLTLLPLYYLLIAVCSLRYPGSFSQDTLLSMLTFTYNGYYNIGNQQYMPMVGNLHWFVSAIMQLYLLSPLVYRFIIKKIPTSPYIFLGIIAGGTLIRIFIFALKIDPNLYIYRYSLTNIDLFFGAFYLNTLIYKREIDVKKAMPLAVFCSFLLFIALQISATLAKIAMVTPVTLPHLILSPPLFLIIIGILIYTCYTPGKKMTALFPGIHFISQFSPYCYAFYLFHSVFISLWDPVLRRLIPYQTVFYANLCLSLVVTVIFSIVIHTAIEKPIQRLKIYF